MKLVFLPGDLHLEQTDDGSYHVTIQMEEILSTRSKRAAFQKFNELRLEMEKRYPSKELTAEQKAELLRWLIADGLVRHNSMGGRKKKTTANSTRTFGG